MRYVLLLAVGIGFTASCTGEDEERDDLTPPSITCDVATSLRLEGTVASSSLSLSTVNGGGTFMNAIGGEPGYLDIMLLYGSSGASATVYLDFVDLLSRGGTAAARGHVVDSSRGLSVGNCETGSYESRIWSIDVEDVDSEEYRWELRVLHDDPYCTGASVSGTLTGCWYIAF